jgi:hypothetical protein
MPLDMPKIRPNLRLSLFSPGLKKLGSGIGQLASEYGSRLSDIVKLPGDVYRGKPITQEDALSFTLGTLVGGVPGGAKGLSAVGMTSRLGAKTRTGSGGARAAGKPNWKALTKEMDEIRKEMAGYEIGSPALVNVRTLSRPYIQHQKRLDELILQKKTILREYL